MGPVDKYNLEAMAAGENYNNYIFGQIRSLAEGRERILDFGAGAGTFANRFDRVIACVEPDEKSATLIDRRHIVRSGLDSLPYNYFDLIYSVNVLEHIEDDHQMMRMLVSKLAPFGELFLFVPARREIYSAMDERVGHVRRYTHQELVGLVSGSGVMVSSCRYFDSLGYMASWGLMAAGKLGWRGGLVPSGVKFYDRMIFPLSRAVDYCSMGSFGKNLVLTAIKP